MNVLDIELMDRSNAIDVDDKAVRASVISLREGLSSLEETASAGSMMNNLRNLSSSSRVLVSINTTEQKKASSTSRLNTTHERMLTTSSQNHSSQSGLSGDDQSLQVIKGFYQSYLKSNTSPCRQSSGTSQSDILAGSSSIPSNSYASTEVNRTSESIDRDGFMRFSQGRSHQTAVGDPISLSASISDIPFVKKLKYLQSMYKYYNITDQLHMNSYDIYHNTIRDQSLSYETIRNKQNEYWSHRQYLSGIELYQEGKYAASLKFFNDAIELESYNIAAIYHRCLVSIKLNDFPAARTDLDMIMQINPNYKNVKDLLETVRKGMKSRESYDIPIPLKTEATSSAVMGNDRLLLKQKDRRDYNQVPYRSSETSTSSNVSGDVKGITATSRSHDSHLSRPDSSYEQLIRKLSESIQKPNDIMLRDPREDLSDKRESKRVRSSYDKEHPSQSSDDEKYERRRERDRSRDKEKRDKHHKKSKSKDKHKHRSKD